jgi:uncharacterized protein (TIGR03437 family)
VSPSQISAIVPYEVTAASILPAKTPVESIVDIQVTNSLGTSNVVTEYVGNTAPGVFTQNQNGTGYGDIQHLTGVYPLVSDSDPAVVGETLAAYLTGLGAVTPPIADGALGAGNTTVNTIDVDVSQVAATNGFSGLTGGLAGLYQLNFTVPATGLTVPAYYLDIAGNDAVGYLDSYMSYPLITVQATSAAASSDTRPPIATPSKPHRTRPAGPAVRIPLKQIYALPAGAGDRR